MANSGQLCCAAKRIFVHESIMDKFTEEFTKQVRNFDTILNHS